MTDVDAFEREVMRSLSGKLHERLRRAGDGNVDVAVFGDPEQIAEAMAAVLPLGHVYDEVSGPFYDTAGLTRWLGISRQALHQKAGRRAILACPLAEGGSVYPAWQFLSSGATISHLADVLAALAAGTDDSWMIALWMRAPNHDLDGDRPSDWLRRGGDPQQVVAAARRVAAGWSS
ncbi:MAG: DNA-packaging protein [Actinomycetia bacterium]|nr:DNA-packaging protein [Actinomycetes bacterium]